MPRQPRLDAPGTLHHVMGRGIEKTKIFREDADRRDFLSRLAELSLKGYLLVYAWALMDSHFHLLVRSGSYPLAKSMRKLLTGYVINFNRRHKRYGHLFQNRYKSIVCEDDPYLLEITRYIHLNPVRAGVVRDLRGLATYPWTGHSALLGKKKREWQDTDTVLSYFGGKKKGAIWAYDSYVGEGISQGRRPELVGGGLIRSLGGWGQVVSLRRRGERRAADDRILGSGEFVERLLGEADEKEKERLRLRGRVKDLKALVAQIAKGEKVGELALRSGGKQRQISRVRRLLCQVAVGKMRYPAAEVARALGVTTSAVVRAAYSEEMPEMEKY
jgi:putative transposase